MEKQSIPPRTRSSFHIPQMPSARWVEAKFPSMDAWMSCWLQNETVLGYWVQFDPDGPFRFVEEIRELR